MRSTASRRARHGLLGILAGIGLSACILPAKLPGLFGGHFKMRVVVAENLNRDSPVALEVLVVYNKKLLKSLEKMTASQWFQNRDQFLKDHSGKKSGLDHWKWEWIPGQVVPEQARPYHIGVAGGVIFANYFAPGDHRASFSPFKPLLLNLKSSGFTAEAID